MVRFVTDDPENDRWIKVNTASVLILDPCHLEHESEYIARLIDSGDAILVNTAGDGTYPVLINSEGDIEVWVPGGAEDRPEICPKGEGRQALMLD